MSSISNSVLESLSALVPKEYQPEKINYISLVNYWGNNWYMAFGRKYFYFINTEFEKFKAPPVPYTKIDACLIC